MMAKKERYLMIQPEPAENGKLPYPYYVKPDGNILRQDFWKGNPAFFCGLAKKGVYEIAVPFSDFFGRKKIDATDLYPVFGTASGEMYTDSIKCTFSFVKADKE